MASTPLNSQQKLPETEYSEVSVDPELEYRALLRSLTYSQGFDLLGSPGIAVVPSISSVLCDDRDIH
jgi:hypothetical protein